MPQRSLIAAEGEQQIAVGRRTIGARVCVTSVMKAYVVWLLRGSPPASRSIKLRQNEQKSVATFTATGQWADTRSICMAAC